MKIDIIIPVHNRPQHTLQTIESLFKNTDNELFNLYVFNDGSDEETSQLLETLKNSYSMTLFVNQEAKGPAWSRNTITKIITDIENRGEYLYHSDNDVYFTEGWLEKLLKTFSFAKDLGVKVLGGSCHPYLQTSEIIGSISGYDIGKKDAVSGYSQLMTWETWDKYGPFDENQGTQEKKIMGSEDWAFCQRIIKDGFLVGSIEPEVVIPCGKTNTYGELATGSETFKEVAGVKVI